mmetsp:Transcript_12297/g.23528  ORF Transcript_12297/g.23528 Transcript_12297/m.23528 type:complete len:201 (+) Transcript_12297:56-658(+)
MKYCSLVVTRSICLFFMFYSCTVVFVMKLSSFFLVFVAVLYLAPSDVTVNVHGISCNFALPLQEDIRGNAQGDSSVAHHTTVSASAFTQRTHDLASRTEHVTGIHNAKEIESAAKALGGEEEIVLDTFIRFFGSAKTGRNTRGHFNGGRSFGDGRGTTACRSSGTIRNTSRTNVTGSVPSAPSHRTTCRVLVPSYTATAR